MAHRWEIDDTVKLSPDYPGSVRRVATESGKPSSEFELTIKKQDESQTLVTMDGEGKPLGGVWVGLYPIGKILGAPPTGYHNWSNAEGELKLSGILPGKYRVAVGGELYGKTVRKEDPDRSN